MPTIMHAHVFSIMATDKPAAMSTVTMRTLMNCFEVGLRGAFSWVPFTLTSGFCAVCSGFGASNGSFMPFPSIIRKRCTRQL